MANPPTYCQNRHIPLLGLGIYRGAALRLKALDAVHEDNLAWLDDYFEDYVNSLTSSKDLVPKTPIRRGKKRKVPVAEDRQLSPPRKHRSTRASERHNEKHDLLGGSASVPSHVEVAKKLAEDSSSASMEVCEKRVLSVLQPVVHIVPLTLPGYDVASTPPAVNNGAAQHLQSKCRLPKIVGFDQMTVKSKALAYEALVNNKGENCSTPSKLTVGTPDRPLKTCLRILEGLSNTTNHRNTPQPKTPSGEPNGDCNVVMTLQSAPPPHAGISKQSPVPNRAAGAPISTKHNNVSAGLCQKRSSLPGSPHPQRGSPSNRSRKNCDCTETEARDSTDSGYPESVQGCSSRAGKGSSINTEHDTKAIREPEQEKHELPQAPVGDPSAAHSSVTGDHSTAAAASTGQIFNSSPGNTVFSVCLQSVSIPKSAIVDTESNNTKDDANADRKGSAGRAPLPAEVVPSATARTKTKAKGREPISTAENVESPPLASTCLRVTRSKMRTAVTSEAASGTTILQTPAERLATKRPNEDHISIAAPPTKQARDMVASKPLSTSTTIPTSCSTIAPSSGTMKKAITDSCLTNKKYCTPDNVRNVALTGSTQKTFLTAKSSTSLLNRSLTSPSQSRISALVTSFVKRTVTPGHGVTAKEKQLMKEKKLQEKEQAQSENKKKMTDILHEKLDSHKRLREEKTKRAAEIREQQEREKQERQRLLEQKQFVKTEALNKAKESKIREEKEKAKLRDQKLQEAEERRKEQELRQAKQKEEEDIAKAKRAREEQERAAAKARAIAENEQRVQEAQRQEQKEKDKMAAARARVAAENERILMEKERLHEEKKARILAEEKRLLAASAASSKNAVLLCNISATVGQQNTSVTVLKDNTNVGVSSSVSTEKAQNPRTTITKCSGVTESYTMTPPPQSSRRKPLVDPDNYDINDLNSGDETDDDSRPRKVVPLWAQGAQFKCALVNQYYHPPETDKIFPEVLRQPCDLASVFKRNKPRYNKRTSSAAWDSPLLKPMSSLSAK